MERNGNERTDTEFCGVCGAMVLRNIVRNNKVWSSDYLVCDCPEEKILSDSQTLFLQGDTECGTS